MGNWGLQVWGIKKIGRKNSVLPCLPYTHILHSCEAWIKFPYLSFLICKVETIMIAVSCQAVMRIKDNVRS